MAVNAQNDLKREYRYVHLFLHSNKGFNLKLIRNLCDPENGFNVDEHLFVTPHKPLYEEVRGICHIEYTEAESYKSKMRMVNQYGDRADWIFIHSLPPEASRWIRQVKDEFLPRIIWRTWGHDVIPYSYERLHSKKSWIRNMILGFYTPVYNLLKKRSYTIGKKKLQQIYGVGIANVIDAINVKEAYGLSKTYRMPYGMQGYGILKDLPQNGSWDDGYYHIMIGHSGASNDRHCESVDQLKKFENEKIMIHVMLAYGIKEYVEEIKKYITENWHGRVEFFEQRMDLDAYAEYMNKMDAMILDAVHSTALGNIGMILYFRKKLFLNRNGVLQKGLVAENIPFHYTDELADMSWEELIRKEEYSVPQNATLNKRDHEACVNDWKHLLNELQEYNAQ